MEKAGFVEHALPDTKHQKETDLPPGHKQSQTIGLPLGKGLCYYTYVMPEISREEICYSEREESGL